MSSVKKCTQLVISARLNETAMTLKFEYPRSIAIENIKFWPIIDQTAMYTLNAAQVISNYLKPLRKSECKINDIQNSKFSLHDINVQQINI